MANDARIVLQQRLTQQLVMTPQLRQAIKILQVSRAELETLVDQELTENPVLEEQQVDEKAEGPAEVPTVDGQNGTEEWQADGEPKVEERDLHVCPSCRSTLVYPVLLYQHGFNDFQMGYASAMAMLLLAVSFGVTSVILINARRWVHYGGVAR